MKKLFHVMICGMALWGSCGAVTAEVPGVKDNPPHKALAKSIERWRDWRFGMFIHWGPVSLTGQEISWSRSNTNPQCPN
ncbi:MAG: alpha-L-fucosidase, partial [bacterium]